jgi:hypothetical protein
MKSHVSLIPSLYISLLIESKEKIKKNTVLTTIEKKIAKNRVNKALLCLR